ncbi:unnamed protein product, partial [Scytosiphon promiscuus]
GRYTRRILFCASTRRSNGRFVEKEVHVFISYLCKMEQSGKYERSCCGTSWSGLMSEIARTSFCGSSDLTLQHGYSFCRLPAACFRLLVSSATGTERTLALSTPMVSEIVRHSVNKQFPNFASLLYPGDLASVETPFVS